MKWKKIDFIDGFENLYEVSNTGSIKRTDSQRELKPTLNTYGYLTVHLSNKKKKKRVFVARMVAMAFIPNPENKPEVDHIDTNRKNNDVSNLRWVTKYENMHNPITESRCLVIHKNNKHGDKGYRDDILKLRNQGKSYKEIAEILNCTKSTVHYHLKGNGDKNNK